MISAKSQWTIHLMIWRIILNEIILSTDRLPVMCSCDYIALTEPYFMAERTPDFNVIVYVVEGSMCITEGECDYELEAGELLFLKKGLHHYGKDAVPRGTKWYFAHFYLDESVGDRPEFIPDPDPLGAGERVELNVILPKRISVSKNGQIHNLFAELVKYSQSEDPYKRLRVNGMLYSLLTEAVLQRYTESAMPRLSDRICAWLGEHCNESFSAARLEKEFFLSYKRMAAVFKAEQGETMQQFHTKCRMTRACYLLRSTAMPVREVANAVGYNDPLYFTRCFRSCEGQSPSDYRNSVTAGY